MFERIVFALCGCMLLCQMHAQTPGIRGVIHEIEHNNKELQAYTSGIQSRVWELKSSNRLPGLSMGAYYLPWGNHIPGDYSEFQVTQTFDFPTLYSARNNLIETQKNQLLLEFEARRQDILLQAQGYCLEIIFLNKRLAVEQLREQQAKRVLDQVQELFDKEQVGILELNKARVSWLQVQFKADQLTNEKQTLRLALQNLNGGKEILFDLYEFEEDLTLQPLDSVWNEKTQLDPALKSLQQQEEIAGFQLKLARMEVLPEFTVGFNHQGIRGGYYYGIYAGLSFPIWSNRSKVKAAEAQLSLRQSLSQVRSSIDYLTLERYYRSHQVLLARFREYQRTLNSLNTDALLLQAYSLGEMSFMEYYMEKQFYHQAFDDMLEMEKQLHQSRAEIFKYNL